MEREAGKKNVVLRRLCVRFAIGALEITWREDLCLVGEVISHPGAGTTNVPALTSDETNPSACSFLECCHDCTLGKAVLCCQISRGRQSCSRFQSPVNNVGAQLSIEPAPSLVAS